MKQLLTLNLQRHAEVDLAAMRQEFEESFKDEPIIDEPNPEPEPEPQSEPGEPETEPGLEPEPTDIEPEQEPETSTEPEQEPESEPESQKQTREENSAFAEMRRQNEALAKQAALVEKAAAKHGMTVDQYLQAVEEAEQEERAKEQNIPVDVLKRLEMLERENSTVRVQAAQERYLSEVNSVKSKYGITDQETESVFRYLGERGLYDQETRTPTISFEDAYKLANFDSLTERKIKEAKQADLEAKRKRQQTTAVPHTNASTATNQDDEITDEFVAKRLKERGLL